MRDAQRRVVLLGLAEDEVAVYDAVMQRDAAFLEPGDDMLKKIAHELVAAVRTFTTTNWKLEESVRIEMRAKIKRLLTGCDYPPDKEERAIQCVLEQAEMLPGTV